MSNELRKKLHELSLLVSQTGDPNTRALLEAIRLQTAVLNERLFAIERQVDELTRQVERQREASDGPGVNALPETVADA